VNFSSKFFLYGIFKEDIMSSEYMGIEPNVRMIVDTEVERLQKEAILLPYLRCHPAIHWENWRKAQCYPQGINAVAVRRVTGRANLLTFSITNEPLPSNVLSCPSPRLMGGIYENGWNGIMFHDIHTKLYENWFSCSNVDKGTRRHTITQNESWSQTLFNFSKSGK
jgi:hypothetical protein